MFSRKQTRTAKLAVFRNESPIGRRDTGLYTSVMHTTGLGVATSVPTFNDLLLWQRALSNPSMCRQELQQFQLLAIVERFEKAFRHKRLVAGIALGDLLLC